MDWKTTLAYVFGFATAVVCYWAGWRAVSRKLDEALDARATARELSEAGHQSLMRAEDIEKRVDAVLKGQIDGLQSIKDVIEGGVLVSAPPDYWKLSQRVDTLPLAPSAEEWYRFGLTKYRGWEPTEAEKKEAEAMRTSPTTRAVLEDRGHRYDKDGFEIPEGVPIKVDHDELARRVGIVKGFEDAGFKVRSAHFGPNSPCLGSIDRETTRDNAPGSTGTTDGRLPDREIRAGDRVKSFSRDVQRREGVPIGSVGTLRRLYDAGWAVVTFPPDEKVVWVKLAELGLVPPDTELGLAVLADGEGSKPFYAPKENEDVWLGETYVRPAPPDTTVTVEGGTPPEWGDREVVAGPTYVFPVDPNATPLGDIREYDRMKKSGELDAYDRRTDAADKAGEQYRVERAAHNHPFVGNKTVGCPGCDALDAIPGDWAGPEYASLEEAELVHGPVIATYDPAYPTGPIPKCLACGGYHDGECSLAFSHTSKDGVPVYVRREPDPAFDSMPGDSPEMIAIKRSQAAFASGERVRNKVREKEGQDVPMVPFGPTRAEEPATEEINALVDDVRVEIMYTTPAMDRTRAAVDQLKPPMVPHDLPLDPANPANYFDTTGRCVAGPLKEGPACTACGQALRSCRCMVPGSEGASRC